MELLNIWWHQNRKWTNRVGKEWCTLGKNRLYICTGESLITSWTDVSAEVIFISSSSSSFSSADEDHLHWSHTGDLPFQNKSGVVQVQFHFMSQHAPHLSADVCLTDWLFEPLLSFRKHHMFGSGLPGANESYVSFSLLLLFIQQLINAAEANVSFC